MNNATNQSQPVNNGKKLETKSGYFVKVFYEGECFFFFIDKAFKKINPWVRTLSHGDFPNYLEYNRLRDKTDTIETYLSKAELAQACRLAKFLSHDPLFGLIKEERVLIEARLKQKAKQTQLSGKTEQKQKISASPKPAEKKVASPSPKKEESGKIVKMNSLSQLANHLKDKFPENVVAAN